MFTNEVYEVNCNDTALNAWLITNVFVKEIFEFTAIDPEFDPVLIGQIKDSKLEIAINFNTLKFQEKLIRQVIGFIQSIYNLTALD